ILVAGVVLVGLSGRLSPGELGEIVQGTPLDSVFRMLQGELRSQARSHGGRCQVTQRAGRPVNIVLIAVDTLRADRLGFQGYARDVSPHMDALARDSLVFRRAISAAPWTTPAFVGVFSGSHPGALGFEGDPLLLPDDVPVVAQLLCDAGWQTAGVVSHSYVGIRYDFDRGFEHWDEREAGGHMHVSSANVTTTAIETLDELSSDDPPFFLLVHYFDPHSDYLEHPGHRFSEGYRGPHRSEADNFNELVKLANSGELDQAAVRHIRDSYDSEIAFTDAQIGRLLAALETRGLYDDALIILLGDHGEMLVERPDRLLGHGMAVYQALIHVPLVVKTPGRTRIGRVEVPVSTVDVLPTILDVVEYEAPPASASRERSLLRIDPARARPVFAQTRRDGFRDAVLEGDWKLIRDTKVGRSELYDLSRDEAETNDIAPLHPDVVAHLEDLLSSWHATLEDSRGERKVTPSPQLTPEEREQLRGLGYLD
ncbi:MAG: sulfatase-like hydrolase/transferase, partial [bacterium]|nr:sulfatase-like hydrolase/transferase [bacterium]